jgi:CelD/BcsL family acetyltransferase involved in cellulose biosynthesis
VLQIDVIRDAGGLLAVAAEWNAVLQSSRSNSIFLTWEWVHTWWAVYGERKRLNVLVVRDEDGSVVGIAPLMVIDLRTLGIWQLGAVRFIGDGGDVTPEHLDIFAKPGREDGVLEACVAHLCADPSIQMIDLRPLSNASGNQQRLRSLLSPRTGHLRCVPDSVCPVLPLPSSSREFLASRSRNYRKKLGEYERRCDRELGAALRVSSSPAELQADMTSLISLHHKRWQGASRAFLSERYCTFHERLTVSMLEKRWLRLFTLEKDKTPLASLYCFAYGKRYSFYQGGRDPNYATHRVGLVLMHRVIQEAINEGAEVFDFLRGDEDYKYRWATTEVRNVRLIYWKSQLASTLDRASSTIRLMKQGLRSSLSFKPTRSSSQSHALNAADFVAGPGVHAVTYL